MTTKHTPEPWRVNPDSTDEVWAGDEPLFAVNAGSDLEMDEATAARIVACVNACAGINPGAVKDLLAALEDSAALLDAIAEGYPDIAMDTRVTKARIRHRAAIAKARGGAA